MQLITQSYFEHAEPSAPSPQSSDVCVVCGGVRLQFTVISVRDHFPRIWVPHHCRRVKCRQHRESGEKEPPQPLDEKIPAADQAVALFRTSGAAVPSVEKAKVWESSGLGGGSRLFFLLCDFRQIL